MSAALLRAGPACVYLMAYPAEHAIYERVGFDTCGELVMCSLPGPGS